MHDITYIIIAGMALYAAYLYAPRKAGVSAEEYVEDQSTTAAAIEGLRVTLESHAKTLESVKIWMQRQPQRK